MSQDTKNTIENWFLELPLYERFHIEGTPVNAAMQIYMYAKTFDTFCPECDKDATFAGIISADSINKANAHRQGFQQNWQTDYIYKEAKCTRQDHRLIYIFVLEGTSLIKIGQYPSLADIASAETIYFKSVLTRTQLHELNKGIGLAAHGVGIGSYVYLRRVFESLIEEAHQLAISDPNWKEQNYSATRMKERIQALAQYLPDFLVQHPELYSHLSEGIHGLSEQECLGDFINLKNAIFVIAEEKLAVLKRKQRAENTSKFLKS